MRGDRVEVVVDSGSGCSSTRSRPRRPAAGSRSVDPARRRRGLRGHAERPARCAAPGSWPIASWPSSNIRLPTLPPRGGASTARRATCSCNGGMSRGPLATKLGAPRSDCPGHSSAGRARSWPRSWTSGWRGSVSRPVAKSPWCTCSCSTGSSSRPRLNRSSTNRFFTGCLIRFLASREVRPGRRVGLAGVRRDDPFHDVFVHDVFGIEDDHAPLEGNISDDLVLVPHEPSFPLVHLLDHGILLRTEGGAGPRPQPLLLPARPEPKPRGRGGVRKRRGRVSCSIVSIDREGPIRVALIGYGLGGRVFHAPLIASVPGTAARHDRDERPRPRRPAREAYPARRRRRPPGGVWDAAADHDLVVVSTPNSSHVPLGLAALDAGPVRS